MDRDKLLHILGDNLKRYREMNHLTQEQLAEKAGISHPFYANLERGNKGVSLFTLKTLADVLGVSTDSLLREENPDSQLDDLVAFLRGKPRAIVAAVDHIIRDLYERKIIG